MTPDDRPGLPVVPSLRVRQGPAPADLAGRAAPPVPPPAAGGLGAAEVGTLLGQGAAATGANRALAEAEGRDPDRGP